jgi:uncharacterized membrane protein
VTAGGLRSAALALGVVLSVAFTFLAHAAIIEGVPPAVGAALSLIPVALLSLWAARRTRHRVVVIAAIAAVALALVLGWKDLERHFPNLLFIEHAGANLALGILFGRTLVDGREPLCTRFARLVHGELPPEVARYSRQVTVAWTVFFATLCTLSCVLYLLKFLEAWSLLANVLTPILVGAMFVIEYAVRLRVLPHWERVGILAAVRAFSRHFARTPIETPR